MSGDRASAVAERRTRATERLQQSVTEATRELPVEAVERLAEVLEQASNLSVSSGEKSALIYRLGGRDYSQQERLELRVLTLLQYFERRRELLRDTLTTTQAARLLGTSRQTPHDRVKAGTLLAVADRGALRFPAWQFDPEGPDGVVSGLPEVLRALKVSPLAKVSWLTSPHPVLGIDDQPRTPMEALKEGQAEQVTALARGAGRT